MRKKFITFSRFKKSPHHKRFHFMCGRDVAREFVYIGIAIRILGRLFLMESYIPHSGLGLNAVLHDFIPRDPESV